MTRLAAAGCVAPEEEAAELRFDVPAVEELEARVRRRVAGEPLAWITGRARFAGLILQIDRGVYVPRAQTEELARRAAVFLPARGIAVDLCTGSGAVAAWLQHAVSDAFVMGVDDDPIAARCAARNGVRALAGDLASALRPSGTVDVVTAVAPYVPSAARRLLPRDVQRHEPAHALDGGVDGLAVVRRVLADASWLLRPGGRLLVEVGGAQDEELRPDLARHGFALVDAWRDDDGDLRGVVAQLVGDRRVRNR